jgi:hypothetical protein
MLGGVLLFTFLEQDSLDDGHADDAVLCNINGAWVLDIMSTHNRLRITFLENLL